MAAWSWLPLLVVGTLGIASAARAESAKDILLAIPYAVKAAVPIAALYPAWDWTGPILGMPVTLTVLAISVPDLLVLKSLASRDPAGLRRSRRIALYSETATAALYFGVGMFIVSGNGRGDEVGLVPLGLSIPMLLLAQLNHIRFDAEDRGPPAEANPVFRVNIPF